MSKLSLLPLIFQDVSKMLIFLYFCLFRLQESYSIDLKSVNGIIAGTSNRMDYFFDSISNFVVKEPNEHKFTYDDVIFKKPYTIIAKTTNFGRLTWLGRTLVGNEKKADYCIFHEKEKIACVPYPWEDMLVKTNNKINVIYGVFGNSLYAVIHSTKKVITVTLDDKTNINLSSCKFVGIATSYDGDEENIFYISCSYDPANVGFSNFYMLKLNCSTVTDVNNPKITCEVNELFSMSYIRHLFHYPSRLNGGPLINEDATITKIYYKTYLYFVLNYHYIVLYNGSHSKIIYRNTSIYILNITVARLRNKYSLIFTYYKNGALQEGGFYKINLEDKNFPASEFLPDKLVGFLSSFLPKNIFLTKNHLYFNDAFTGMIFDMTYDAHNDDSILSIYGYAGACMLTSLTASKEGKLFILNPASARIIELKPDSPNILNKDSFSLNNIISFNQEKQGFPMDIKYMDDFMFVSFPYDTKLVVYDMKKDHFHMYNVKYRIFALSLVKTLKTIEILYVVPHVGIFFCSFILHTFDLYCSSNILLSFNDVEEAPSGRTVIYNDKFKEVLSEFQTNLKKVQLYPSIMAINPYESYNLSKDVRADIMNLEFFITASSSIIYKFRQTFDANTLIITKSLERFHVDNDTTASILSMSQLSIENESKYLVFFSKFSSFFKTWSIDIKASDSKINQILFSKKMNYPVTHLTVYSFNKFPITPFYTKEWFIIVVVLACIGITMNIYLFFKWTKVCHSINKR